MPSMAIGVSNAKFSNSMLFLNLIKVKANGVGADKRAECIFMKSLVNIYYQKYFQSSLVSSGFFVSFIPFVLTNLHQTLTNKTISQN